jgi:hypothetical protein
MSSYSDHQHPQEREPKQSLYTKTSVMTMGSQLLVMDSHYLRTITIQKHPRFHLGGTPMLTLTISQFPYHLRRALSPYMVQEMLMVDGSASEVLRTHVQHRRHSRLISSTSTALYAQEWCLKSSSTLYCTQCHIHHSSI